MPAAPRSAPRCVTATDVSSDALPERAGLLTGADSEARAVPGRSVKPPPLLVVGIGNPSRGDDALGPALLQVLHAAGAEASGQVELLTDFQLQVEHALDLDGRAAVLFVDAARPGAVHGAALSPLPPARTGTIGWTSHALEPGVLLALCERTLGCPPPPAWQLAIEGESFELGGELSAAARRHLRQACALAEAWLAQRVAACGQPSA
jgi:hydrogenase maturation protease